MSAIPSSTAYTPATLPIGSGNKTTAHAPATTLIPPEILSAILPPSTANS